MSMGEKIIDAMMNLRVASSTGERVCSASEAATKLMPQTVATNNAARVPRLMFWMVNNYLLYTIRIYSLLSKY
jgi:hypothetical protein